MILLDSAHPDQFSRLPEEFYNLQVKQARSLEKVIKLAQKDYLEYSKGEFPPLDCQIVYYQIIMKLPPNPNITIP
jgi:hypothetical protein